MTTTTHRRQYVLDTSVLIHDPEAFKQFPNSDVIIPIAVLNELDKLKKGSGDVARNARVAIRTLDQISELGDISVGVLLDHDIMLKIDAEYLDCNQSPYLGFGEPSYGDTQILACALKTWKQHPALDVVLVSNDINLRIKAKSRSIETEAREGKSTNISEMYSGVQIINNVEAGIQLQQHGFIDPYDFDLYPHEFVIFQDEDGNDIAMGRRNVPDKISIIKKFYPWNINARNREQQLSIDMIMDKDVDLITMVGRAGCGKSLIAISCALELVLNKREYEKVIIYKSLSNIGADLGYLPGSKSEKLEPWMGSVNDALELLFSSSTKSTNNWKQDLEMYQKKGRIELDSFSYIRGRSIPNTIIIIDEAQNVNKSDMKTLLTRAGDHTKIIVLGDVEQIDLRENDAMNNGLSYVIDNFRSSWISSHITLITGERSRLATAASEIL